MKYINDGIGVLPSAWRRALGSLRFDWQPIFRSSEGSVFGWEALLRGFEEPGFDSIGDVFDKAFSDGVIPAIELGLREKAFCEFAEASMSRGSRMFVNVDNRAFRGSWEASAHMARATRRLAHDFGLDPASIILEVSERHEVETVDGRSRAVEEYRKMGFPIALDDFGSGYSGLTALCAVQPDFVKLDRFLIAKIESHWRKRVLAKKMVELGKDLGARIVAEGIESEAEGRICTDLGCDFLQGFAYGMPGRIRGGSISREGLTEIAGMPLLLQM